MSAARKRATPRVIATMATPAFHVTGSAVEPTYSSVRCHDSKYLCSVNLQERATQKPEHNQAQLDCERALSDLMAEEVWQDHAAAGLVPGWGKLPSS